MTQSGIPVHVAKAEGIVLLIILFPTAVGSLRVQAEACAGHARHAGSRADSGWGCRSLWKKAGRG